jgi:hypothetical protein
MRHAPPHAAGDSVRRVGSAFQWRLLPDPCLTPVCAQRTLARHRRIPHLSLVTSVVVAGGPYGINDTRS